MCAKQRGPIFICQLPLPKVIQLQLRIWGTILITKIDFPPSMSLSTILDCQFPMHGVSVLQRDFHHPSSPRIRKVPLERN